MRKGRAPGFQKGEYADHGTRVFFGSTYELGWARQSRVSDPMLGSAESWPPPFLCAEATVTRLRDNRLV